MADDRGFVDVDLERTVFVEAVDPLHAAHRRGCRVWLEMHDDETSPGTRLSIALSGDDARALGQRLIEFAGGAAPGESPR